MKKNPAGTTPAVAMIVCVLAATQIGAGGTAALLEGELLHTGMRVTPTAAPGIRVPGVEPRAARSSRLRRRPGGQHRAEPGRTDAPHPDQRLQPDERGQRQPPRGLVERIRLRVRRERTGSGEAAGADRAQHVQRDRLEPERPGVLRLRRRQRQRPLLREDRRRLGRAVAAPRPWKSSQRVAATTSPWPPAWPSTRPASFSSWRTCSTTRSPW